MVLEVRQRRLQRYVNVAHQGRLSYPDSKIWRRGNLRFSSWMDLISSRVSPESKSLSLDVFFAVRILVSGASQVQKMVTRSEKSEPVDYSNDDWYTDIYHYYTN